MGARIVPPRTCLNGACAERFRRAPVAVLFCYRDPVTMHLVFVVLVTKGEALDMESAGDCEGVDAQVMRAWRTSYEDLKATRHLPGRLKISQTTNKWKDGEGNVQTPLVDMPFGTANRYLHSSSRVRLRFIQQSFRVPTLSVVC